jgi:Txe/YoeB family toxin of Txe-Axe toxin-antitoxin module
MQQNLPKIAQNLLKSAQRQNFEIPPKIEIVEEALEHVFTVRIFNPRFFYVFFIVKEWPLYVKFSIPLCGK